MFIVDRIEDDIVVVEYSDGYLNIPIDLFNEEVSEGDVLYLGVDKEKTLSRKEEMTNRLNKLFNKNK
jgi:hypothetical protein